MPGRRFDGFRGAGGEPPVRPSDPAVRKANLRRIIALFRRYRARLSLVCGLIVISASLGVVPSFLLREVLDVAIQVDASTDQATVDMPLLIGLVAGMVAIRLCTSPVRVRVKNASESRCRCR